MTNHSAFGESQSSDRSNTQSSVEPLFSLGTSNYEFGNIRDGLFSRNFAYAKFRENRILAKWQNHSVIYWYKKNHAQVAKLLYRKYVF